MAKRTQASKAETSEQPPGALPEPALADREIERQLREIANTIRERHEYSGELTSKLYLELQPLLEEPLPPGAFAHVERKKVQTRDGEKWNVPFSMTGVKSVQWQADRLNGVLGRQHWRAIRFFPGGGEICKVVAVVGNGLDWCRLDDHGNLVPYFVENGHILRAQVLATEEGWGGYTKGRDRGDVYKGSETNAMKRTLARLGPGAEFYRLDFEDDPERPEAPAPRAEERPSGRSSGTRAGSSDDDLSKQLQALLTEESPLQDQRRKAVQGMALLGAPVRQQVRELMQADDGEKLTALVDRLNTKLDDSGQQSLGA